MPCLRQVYNRTVVNPLEVQQPLLDVLIAFTNLGLPAIKAKHAQASMLELKSRLL